MTRARSITTTIRTVPRRQRRRRGLTSVLAMLYLVLFATLAIGFYAASNSHSQIVSNDERTARAQLACESGMDFMRYQLGRVYIPPEPLPPGEVIIELHHDLAEQLHDTGNLGAQHIELVGNTIQIPAGGGTIRLDEAGTQQFRATITDWAGEIVVKVDGIHGSTSASRAITMDFTRVEHPTTVFDYAVASKGQVVAKKGEITSVAGVDPSIVHIMSGLGSDGAITVTGATIGGDLSVLEGVDPAITGGSTVGGESNLTAIYDEHVHEVDPPTWPEFDTTVYEPYATTIWSHGAPLVNVRIPAGTNPKFAGNKTIQGIVFIESPNTVEFQGNVNLQGFVVFENAGDDSVNKILISGNVTQSPLPNSPEFDPLRATSGIAFMAPTAAIIVTGSGSSGDSYIRGSVITSTFSHSGAAAMQIDRGTIMAMKEASNAVVLESSKGLRFTATGKGNAPTMGVKYSTYFEPDPTSYQEVSR